MDYSTTILHVFHDDKFIDAAIDVFSRVPSKFKEEYHLIVKSQDHVVKHVKSNLAIKKVMFSEKAFKEYAHSISLNNYSAICFHSLSGTNVHILNFYNGNSKIIWFSWGFGIYNKWFPFQSRLLEPKTRKQLNLKLSVFERIISNNIIYRIFGSIPYKFIPGNKIFEKIKSKHPNSYLRAIAKIDYVAPVIKNEMYYINKVSKRLSYIPFNYGSYELKFNKSLEKDVTQEKDVLIGNSGDYSNNHLDIFEMLKNIDITDRKIIVPLNYGGDKEYIETVIKEGEKCFGENFEPLTEFLPLVEYDKILSKCGIVIFNHRRQQAGGNFVVMSYKGAKIFLNKKSPFYKLSKENNLKVYALDDITQKDFDTVLTMSEVEKQRVKIKALFGIEEVKRKIQVFYEIIDK
ncbi:hypothetical protein GCM10011344_31130 [Dokdonia pacifica]|uniref:4-alpha-L-fucosyltransferase glycosyl transferase group 56 n=1 Tax=Dokdonia pacifica TaxID=1627892 RepID=A0A239BRM3_9FLAO|nr:TDP-N-acetylfucosamine:lipid II N-acetylfucosaminyltransferase [Dokdonia pacifica]GGG28112.1 hypothetical protein GCM10011344_31130 [Dokdonia pacifica]SNS10061.1 4-alpha-L-fucosyltransferase glycosyl transferase group 56 [Dokdonia pacifica]